MMSSIMENSSNSSRPQMHDDKEFSLRECALKAKITRENINSRRHSASYIRSFREEARSFRSNITIPSTTSSPGYPFYKDEIDPATYSFTTALKALQARSNYNSWDCISPEGFALHSKWSEAEKYICNPLSGEVPIECLSAKALRRRSCSNFMDRITMSAPLNYPSHLQSIIKTNQSTTSEDEIAHIPIEVKKMVGSTRDVGIQSTLDDDMSTSCPSNASSSSAEKISLKQLEAENKQLPNKLSSQLTPEKELQVKATREKDDTKRDKKEGQAHSFRQSGCFSWVVIKRQRENTTQRKGI